MSHLFESGFCVREPSWHGLETVIADYPADWDAARTIAGLSWDPVVEPIYVLDGIDEEGKPRYVEEPKGKRVVRSDTGQTLSVNSGTWALIDHGRDGMGGIATALLESVGGGGNMHIETMGSLDEGRRVYACMYLDEPIVLPLDATTAIYPFLAIVNHHDGSGACKAMATAIRIVCANTQSLAEMTGERDGTLFTFRHTANWRDRVEEAAETIQGLRGEMAEWTEIARGLCLLKITKRQRADFVNEFIPMPPGDVISDRVVANIDEARLKMFDLFDSPTVAPIADTGWGLVQAATEYLDHLRAYRSSNTYFGRQLLRPEPLKTRAVKLVREIAAA